MLLMNIWMLPNLMNWLRMMNNQSYLGHMDLMNREGISFPVFPFTALIYRLFLALVIAT